MFKFIVLIVAAAFLMSPSANAKGSSYVTTANENVSGFVSIKDAPRAMRFTDTQTWQSTDGRILVCPLGEFSEYNHGRTCKDKATEKIDAWKPIQEIAPPGFEVVGYQFSASGGGNALIVYFGKKQ